jgi:uncharacterized protein (DUF427 family)
MPRVAVRMSDALPAVDQLRYEPSPRWVRGELNGETVVDSRDVWLIWEPGRVVPGWCFPAADVRRELIPGDIAKALDDPDMEGRVAVDYYRLDRWREEEEEIVGHPRDPFKRVDVRRSSRHVRVTVGGTLVADSKRPLMLFETGLPVRYYLPRDDVRVELLEPSDTHSLCAYKGRASYYSLAGAADAVWFYPDPLPDNAVIKGHLAFWNERADIEVDGELLERPETKWSRPASR